MTEDHIVEVYAAADSFEAERLRELLEEAGIQARVVGDEINQAAGSVTYGGVASPRVWVHENDKDEAVQLIEEWRAEKAEGADDAAVDQAEWQSELDAEGETGEEPPVEVEGVSALGKVLIMFGLGCILLGASFAWSNRRLAESYSAETEAVRVAVLPSMKGGPPDPKTHEPRSFDGFYEYRVKGETYEAILPEIASADDAPATAPVRYNPAHPREHLLGAMPSPWPPLAFGGFFGVLVMFIVYRLN